MSKNVEPDSFQAKVKFCLIIYIEKMSLLCMSSILSNTTGEGMLLPWVLLVFAMGLAGVAIIILYGKGKVR